MTLGLFMPLLAALGSLFAVPLFVWQLRRLPGSTDPAYDAARVDAKARVFRLIIAFELAIPVLIYLILNVAMAEEGRTVLF